MVLPLLMFCLGMGFLIHSMYLVECTPKRLRSMVGVTISLYISIGKFTGQLLGLRFVKTLKLSEHKLIYLLFPTTHTDKLLRLYKLCIGSYILFLRLLGQIRFIPVFDRTFPYGQCESGS